MGYRILADALVLVHLAFVVFVVAGGGLVLWRRWVAFLHVPAALWGIWIEWSGGVCPLTPLEQRARLAGGEAGYAGSFIDHYLVPVLYPPGLGREQQVALGLLVAAINLLVYGSVLVRWARSRRSRASGGEGTGD